MTRLSQSFIPTLKNPPSDAEAISHKLLVRAGMVRQMGSGLWTWLPAGLRVHRKVEAILREEMDRAGAQEMIMPVMQPAEPWKKTGRYAIDEMFKLEDRKGSELVLAMTHEECVTGHMAGEIRSYRDLPKLVYQIQTKERDEPRPRAGVLRTREFVMKDAYSFDRDEAGLETVYARMIAAYDRIFERSGLNWYRVESDVGMMGGSGAHEYMAPCAAGEDTIALAPGYAANLEIASSIPREIDRPPLLDAPEEIETPDLKTVAEVAAALRIESGALIKAVPVVTTPDRGEGEFVLILVRGDHHVNQVKLDNTLRTASRPANPVEIEAKLGPAGFIGPVAPADPEVRILKDRAITGGGLVAGANRRDLHLQGVEPGRDFDFEEVDVRSVEAGDLTPDGQEITLEPAIEVANIFKLGTRYSEPLDASYLDEDGKERTVVMGSYGIGPARIVAAAAEQFADEKGLSWPKSLAPWTVHLVALSKPGEPERDVTDRLYDELVEAGIEVLYDDRDGGTGQKLTDAELIGCPLRVVAGRRGLAEGKLDGSERRSGTGHDIPVEGAATRISELIRNLT